MFGYKMIAISGDRLAIAKLHIPRNSVVVETDYKMNFRGMPQGYQPSPLMRTNEVTTMSIIPVGGKECDMVASGTSIRSHSPLTYISGKSTKGELDLSSGHGNGIHFFWDEKAANLWNAMFK